MKAAVPVPVDTTMRKRWRWDRFLTAGEAADWIRVRTAEGQRVYQRGLWVAWDQTSRGAEAVRKILYPRERIDHCPHCEERRTFIRSGSGARLVKFQNDKKRGRRDYQYVEDPPHACPGLLAERAAMRRSTARLSAMMMGRILRGG